jgi:hypothetical protein
MGIELLIVVLAAGAGLAFWYFNRDAKSTDLNSDGKTDFNDLVVAVDNTVVGLKATADVNKDGKVDVADVKVVAKKAKAGAKKAADVNKDGKVNAKDAKAAVAKSVAKAEVAAKRARKGGKFVADDPSTPDVNEAFKRGKAPKK